MRAFQLSAFQFMSKNALIYTVAGLSILILATFVILGKKEKPQEANREVNETTDQMPQQITTTNIKKQYNSAPEMQLETEVDYKAVIKTSKGDITVDLFETEVPVTVNNFVFLAKEGFYDGTKFHRIIKGFMIQGGDPLGNGMGGPGYKFADEQFSGEYSRGTVAMANSGPNTNGSQFFIIHEDYPLPANYTIFGRATDESSLAVLDAIAATPVTKSYTGEMSVPTEDAIVTGVEIVETP